MNTGGQTGWIPDEKTDLFSNIKALLMHRIASFSLQSTSSVIIMYFQNSVAAGIYGNYTLITNALINLSNQIYNGILASFGNLITTESKEKTLRNFNALYLLNYLIFSFFSIWPVRFIRSVYGTMDWKGRGFLR